MSELYPAAEVETITAEEAGEVQTQADPAAPFLKTLFRIPFLKDDLKAYKDDSVSLRAVAAMPLDMHITNVCTIQAVPEKTTLNATANRRRDSNQVFSSNILYCADI